MDVLCLGSEADVSIRRSFSKRNAFAMFLLKIEGGEKDKEVLSSCGHVNRDFESEAKVGITFNSNNLGGISKLTMSSA